MAETYCGKTCAECAQKETLNCPGCMAGPGRPDGGDCVLAKCAREKNLETCAACADSGTCGMIRGRYHMPERRLQGLTAGADPKTTLAARAPIIGKWLWLLFWMFIPNGIAGVLTNRTFMESAPALVFPGQILDAICALAFGGIMLQLKNDEDKFRLPGIFWMIAGALRLLVAVSDGTYVGLLIALAATVCALVGQFMEFGAYAHILSGVDAELSGKWLRLRTWLIILYCAFFACTVLTGVMPLLGALLSLAVNLGLSVVGIMRIVRQYKSAQEFRYYCA